MRRKHACVFDLGDTPVGSVYQHALAWQKALHHPGMAVSVWRSRRQIGASAGPLAHALLRETGRPVSPTMPAGCARLTLTRFGGAYGRCVPSPVPGNFWRSCASLGCLGPSPRVTTRELPARRSTPLRCPWSSVMSSRTLPPIPICCSPRRGRRPGDGDRGPRVGPPRRTLGASSG
jgi:hypothetical protein